MAYVDPNYPNKKAFKDAVARGVKHYPYSPGPFQPHPNDTEVYIEGPHYPKPHRWYAKCRMENGVIVKVD